LDGSEPGDRTPEDDPAVNPLSPGIPNYDFYSMEVVQRMGNDSYTPDNGVLMAKNKDSLRGRNGGPNAFNSYIWVIDAHPEDISMVDYVKPNGQEVMRTVADYRQLNDALFHAGPDSGSEFEWVDEPNRLQFYVVELQKNEEGILSYTLGVRSLDGSGPGARGVELSGPEKLERRGPLTPVTFHLSNTGSGPGPDIYRLSLTVQGEGWSGHLPNALAWVRPGDTKPVTVHFFRESDAVRNGTLTLRAVSESDPSKSAVFSVALAG
jgi:hypothetical protein